MTGCFKGYQGKSVSKKQQMILSFNWELQELMIRIDNKLIFNQMYCLTRDAICPPSHLHRMLPSWDVMKPALLTDAAHKQPFLHPAERWRSKEDFCEKTFHRQYDGLTQWLRVNTQEVHRTQNTNIHNFTLTVFLEQASRIWNPDETSLSVLAVEFSHGLHNCYLFHIIFHASLRQQNFVLTQRTLRRVFPRACASKISPVGLDWIHAGRFPQLRKWFRQRCRWWRSWSWSTFQSGCGVFWHKTRMVLVLTQDWWQGRW